MTHHHTPAPFFPGAPHGLCRSCRAPMNRSPNGNWTLAPRAQPEEPLTHKRLNDRGYKAHEAAKAEPEPTSMDKIPAALTSAYRRSCADVMDKSSETPFLVMRLTPKSEAEL